MDIFEKKILDNRNVLRENNLQSEIVIWKKISQLKDDDENIKIIRKNDDISFKILSSNYTDVEKKKYQRILDSFAKSIFRINSTQYKLSKITDINIKILKKHANYLLNIPLELQLYFCTEPNRQGVDEEFQIKFLNEGIKQSKLNAKKPDKHYYIFSGEITEKKSKTAKSIDVVITKKNENYQSLDFSIKKPEIFFFGYCKVIITSGGHQDNQIKDAISFINESYKHLENNNDQNFYYFVQLDGKEAIRQLAKVKNEIKHKNKIFAGTTDTLIKWINNKCKKEIIS